MTDTFFIRVEDLRRIVYIQPYESQIHKLRRLNDIFSKKLDKITICKVENGAYNDDILLKWHFQKIYLTENGILSSLNNMSREEYKKIINLLNIFNEFLSYTELPPSANVTIKISTYLQFKKNKIHIEDFIKKLTKAIPELNEKYTGYLME